MYGNVRPFFPPLDVMLVVDGSLATLCFWLIHDLLLMDDDLVRLLSPFVNNPFSKRLESGIVLLWSAVYNSSAISFGEKMARIISADHLSKNCTYELNPRTKISSV